jgi:hypothetical protein
MRGRDGGENLTNVRCKHVQESPNVSHPIQLMYANTNALRKTKTIKSMRKE